MTKEIQGRSKMVEALPIHKLYNKLVENAIKKLKEIIKSRYK